MSILIAYATSHGCTENCAHRVREQLSAAAQLLNLKKDKPDDLSGYDTIIIGGSIHMGKMQKSVKKFCDKQLPVLLEKKIGLFMCCMEEGENAQHQFDDAFPKTLRQHATATGMFGGEFNFEKMNFLQRAIVKKVSNLDHSISKISDEKISEFVTALQ